MVSLRTGQQDSQSDASSSNTANESQQRPKRGALRQYVDTFGQDTIQEMARVVSQEAATIIEMQSVALFGDYRLLQEQMEVFRSQQPSLVRNSLYFISL